MVVYPPNADTLLLDSGVLCVAGHCRCASTIRGPFPDCATSQSRENAGVGRPFALCIVRAMLSHIDSDPIQQGEMCVGVASQECLSAPTTLTLRRSTAARAYVHSDRQGAGASARNFSDAPKKPGEERVVAERCNADHGRQKTRGVSLPSGHALSCCCSVMGWWRGPRRERRPGLSTSPSSPASKNLITHL